LNKEKIDIQVNEHSITVKGQQTHEEDKKSPGQSVHAKSIGLFMKTIPLPIDADTAKVTTEHQGDILVIRLPKKNK